MVPHARDESFMPTWTGLTPSSVTMTVADDDEPCEPCGDIEVEAGAVRTVSSDETLHGMTAPPSSRI